MAKRNQPPEQYWQFALTEDLVRNYVQSTKRVDLWPDVKDLDIRMCLIFCVDRGGDIKGRVRGTVLPGLVKIFLEKVSVEVMQK